MDPLTAIKDESLPEYLMSIPDPDADKFPPNAENRVRRSVRMTKRPSNYDPPSPRTQRRKSATLKNSGVKKHTKQTDRAPAQCQTITRDPPSKNGSTRRKTTKGRTPVDTSRHDDDPGSPETFPTPPASSEDSTDSSIPAAETIDGTFHEEGSPLGEGLPIPEIATQDVEMPDAALPPRSDHTAGNQDSEMVDPLSDRAQPIPLPALAPSKSTAENPASTPDAPLANPITDADAFYSPQNGSSSESHNYASGSYTTGAAAGSQLSDNSDLSQLSAISSIGTPAGDFGSPAMPDVPVSAASPQVDIDESVQPDFITEAQLNKDAPIQPNVSITGRSDTYAPAQDEGISTDAGPGITADDYDNVNDTLGNFLSLSQVQLAKEQGNLHNDYDSGVVRVGCDGGYWVPKKCYGCIRTNEFCDRGQPCRGCSAASQECCRDRGMTLAMKASVMLPYPGLLRRHEPRRAAVAVAEGGLDPRPRCCQEPIVWAESRHIMCETLPYYRAFQSAAYISRGYCYALLVDKQCGERDMINEHIVIARAGGCMAKEDNEMVQTKDQTSENPYVRAMRKNMEEKVPLVLILGRDNPKCPTIVPHRYCVMDYFHVTKVWCEKNGTKDMFMFRFEKLDLDKASWWAPTTDSRLPRRPDEALKPARAVCLYCRAEHEQIYTVGWMCLTETCPAFWTIGRAPPPARLEYTREFLEHRTAWEATRRPPFRLRPELPRTSEGAEVDKGYGYSRSCWKGIVCPHCGRCNARLQWTEWMCETEGCNFTHSVPQWPITARFVADGEMVFSGHAIPFAQCADYVGRSHRLVGNYRVNTFTLPACGTVTHIQSNEIINARENGPDSTFLQLQTTDIGLKRFPMSNSIVAGALTAHFAVNYGMPYKYVVEVDSRSFAEAPPLVLNVLRRLSWAAREALGSEPMQQFNEMLAVGYFEEQKMNFHDDGEAGLGPTVATYSLGADATMIFRMKKVHYTGCNRGGQYRESVRPVPGCRLYQQRLEYHEAGDGMTSKSRASQKKKFEREKNQNAPAAITLTLKHGDILIMHGAPIQTYYEHAVQPGGKLRFALTCRSIDPKSVSRDQRWKGDSTISPQDEYHGDFGPPSA